MLPENHTSSLASLLGITLHDLLEILTYCGLTHKKKGVLALKIIPSTSGYSWSDFMIEQNLHESYFDKMKVSKVSKKNEYWIGLGCLPSKRGDYNPKSQFDIYQHPPTFYSRKRKNSILPDLVNH